jgi:hypothetical protein
MGYAFAVLAFLIGLVSWLFVSQVTAGAAGIGFACLLAIFARMLQSEAHHRKVMARLTMQGPPVA